MRIIKKWTDEEKSLAKQMAILGHSHRVIGERLGRTKKSVQCLFAGERTSKGGPCVKCGAELCSKNSTGFCRPCFARKNSQDPAVRAKFGAACAAHMKANPHLVRERAKKAANTKRANPELMAKLADVMRQKVQPKSCTPEALARREYKERGKNIRKAKVPWCPPEYMAEYRWLCDSKLLLAADARRIIEEKMAADRRRAKATRPELSPFERQERALANGAAIIANDQKPSLANPGIYEERKAG
jgi:hypothetical protein